MDMTEHRPLRLKDVTEQTGFSRKTIETAMRTGELRANKVGGRWITRQDWVNAWLYGDRPDPKTKKNRLHLTP